MIININEIKQIIAEELSQTDKNDIERMIKQQLKSDLEDAVAKAVEKVDPMDVAARLSWRKGSLIFRGESLAEAMAEIGRYTNIDFELSEDDRLKQVQVAGMFKTGDIKGLLEVLNNNFNIDYERVSPDKIRLKYAAPHVSI